MVPGRRECKPVSERMGTGYIPNYARLAGLLRRLILGWAAPLPDEKRENMPGLPRSARLINISLISTIALAPTLAPTLATAAVRTCAAPVLGAPQSAPTELQARKQALEAWAKAAGTVPSAWRLATDKHTACAPIAGQSGAATTCVVRARPCLIDQMPGRGWVPDLSPKPGAPAPAPTPAARPGPKPLNI
jgi:hypothetical protein